MPHYPWLPHTTHPTPERGGGEAPDDEGRSIACLGWGCFPTSWVFGPVETLGLGSVIEKSGSWIMFGLFLQSSTHLGGTISLVGLGHLDMGRLLWRCIQAHSLPHFWHHGLPNSSSLFLSLPNFWFQKRSCARWLWVSIRSFQACSIFGAFLKAPGFCRAYKIL